MEGINIIPPIIRITRLAPKKQTVFFTGTQVASVGGAAFLWRVNGW